MALVDLILLGLTALSVPFAIIELGLTAYVINNSSSYIFYSEYTFRSQFLLFTSLWTILIGVLLLVFPIVFGRSGASPRWAVPVTITFNSITMIFWLSGFAAWAEAFRYFALRGVDGAIIAFAIMEWLIFLALLVISVLTATNVVRSDRFGYGSTTRKSTLP